MKKQMFVEIKEVIVSINLTNKVETLNFTKGVNGINGLQVNKDNVLIVEKDKTIEHYYGIIRKITFHEINEKTNERKSNT